MGFVYVIEAPGAFKVGIAGNVKRRLASLQTGSPERLVLRNSYEAKDARAIERALHKALKPYRKHGEWFDLAGLDQLTREIERECAAGILFAPGDSPRFLAARKRDAVVSVRRPAVARRYRFSSVREALDLLWPSGHFPRWDDHDPAMFRKKVYQVMACRGGTYHYPQLYAALLFVRKEGESDPRSVRHEILSRGRPPYPEPDPITYCHPYVHSPNDCSVPHICPGRFRP